MKTIGVTGAICLLVLLGFGSGFLPTPLLAEPREQLRTAINKIDVVPYSYGIYSFQYKGNEYLVVYTDRGAGITPADPPRLEQPIETTPIQGR